MSSSAPKHPDDSDVLLLAAVREGAAHAYAELWRRHSEAGRALARRHTRTFDPDDLVSEAFGLILQAIRNGRGPTGAFRPYLSVTIKNVAATWGAREQRLPTTSMDALERVDADATRADLTDRLGVAELVQTLPARWQQALWHSEVEGRSISEMAEIFGIKPTAVAMLTCRARAGLRRAWNEAGD